MVEDKIKTLQKALEQKAKTAFEIQIQLNETKTIAYPHDYKWVSLEDVKTELGYFRVEYDKQVHPSRKQLQDTKTSFLKSIVKDESYLLEKIEIDDIETLLDDFLDKLLSGSEETK